MLLLLLFLLKLMEWPDVSLYPILINLPSDRALGIAIERRKRAPRKSSFVGTKGEFLAPFPALCDGGDVRVNDFLLDDKD